MKIRTLLIGLGNIGLKYDLNSTADIFYTHAKALTHHEGFDLISAVDIDSDNRKAFEQKYNKIAYSSLKELPQKDFDLIIVATPTSMRIQILKEIENNLKFKKILLEKPLSPTLKEANEILSWEQRLGCEIFINYIRHPDPSTSYLRDCISKENYGKLLKVNLVYNRGLKNSASHFLEMLQSFLGDFSEFKLVSGEKINDTDYSADFNLTFKTGVNVFCSSINFSEMNLGEMHFYFENGIIRYLDQGNEIQVFRKSPDPKVSGRFEFVLSGEKVQNELFKYQLNVLNEIEKSFNGQSYNLTDSKKAYQLVELCENIANEIRAN